MKKIRDISSNLYDENIRLIGIKKILKVEKISRNQDNFQDITPSFGKDIKLYKKQKIRVSKKKTKNFDALENITILEKILMTKDIVIKKNKKHRRVFSYTLYIRRFFKKSNIYVKALMICFVFLGVSLLGYGDKLLIESRVNSGYEQLLQVKQGGLELREIQKKVNNARFDLLFANILFSPFSLLSGDAIDSVGYVISGGRFISKSMDAILALYTKVDMLISEKSLRNIYFTQLFLNISPELKSIEKSLTKSLENYQNITWLPNDALYDKKDIVVEGIEKMLGYMKKLNKNFPSFLNILGHSEKKRYLVVFQNADEIRPTGGFMGSMGLLEIFRGKVQLFQKKDVYAIEWDLKKSNYKRLTAPKGIDKLTNSFGLRDANYYVNLKDSSKTIKFFTDRAGISIDGIIYVNQNILLRLLEITGPVYFEILDKEITSENFSEIMSLVVEAKTFKKGTLGSPKQVLFDFMEIFTEKLISNGQYFEYLQTIIYDIENRDLMMWSFNDTENNFLELFGLNGSINYKNSLDYSYPVYTSLSGNKSDRYMKRSYKQKVKSGKNCSYDVSLEIQSTHNMGKLKRERIQGLIEEYKLDSPNLFEIQGAATNKQFVRVILPQEAEIIPQKNMEIVEYGSRKGVEFFLDTQLQETTYYTIDYTLPNTQCQNYDYTFYKQSGIPSYDMDIQINENRYSYQDWQEDFYFEEREK